MPRKRVVMILADGTRPDVFEDHLLAGHLPHIADAFPEGHRRSAFTVFPTTTGPAFLPFMTGMFPGQMNLPGIRWFDRRAYSSGEGSASRSYVGVESWGMNTDVDRSFKTIFDLEPDSLNIFSAVSPGLDKSGELARFSRGFWWLLGHETNRWDLVHLRARKHMLKALDQDPRFLFLVIPDVDSLCHISNPRSTTVSEAYGRLDETVGLLFGELDRRNWRDDTLVMIVSDHGGSEVRNHLGLPEWMEQRGMRPYYYPRIWRRHFDSSVMISGNGMAHIHLRNGEKWTPEPVNDEEILLRHGDFLKDLIERPEIDLVVTRSGDGTVVARSRRGESRMNWTASGSVEYTPVSGDAFGYDGLAGVLTRDDFLCRTRDTKYPDGAVQLLQIVESSRTGDIIVSAEVGHDLRDKHERPEHFAGHGALHREHMCVPWFSTRPLPDVPLRTVDVFPEVLRWLDLPVPEGIDGRLIEDIYACSVPDTTTTQASR
jgi:hypothetical protein